VATWRVVLTDQVFPDVGLERALLAEIDAELIVPGRDRATVLAAAAGADALLNTYFPIGAEDFAAFERCRIVARYGIGVDNLDLAAARAAGIVVTNVPDYCVEEVAVHTLALILASIRRLPAAITAGAMEPWTLDGLRPIARVSELTFGVVGLGRIGRTVIDLLRPLGGRIVGYDPYAPSTPDGVERVADLDDLLRAADVVTLHLPVTPETRGFIGSPQLALLKPTAILVNTSRGALVSTAALAETLQRRAIGGAAVDVLEREAADAATIAGLPGAIVTPHMAYYSESSLRDSQRKAATQVVKVLTGLAADYPVT
jgi:D-3-phosphoglycerate dehydrogenase